MNLKAFQHSILLFGVTSVYSISHLQISMKCQGKGSWLTAVLIALMVPKICVLARDTKLSENG